MLQAQIPRAGVRSAQSWIDPGNRARLVIGSRVEGRIATNDAGVGEDWTCNTPIYPRCELNTGRGNIARPLHIIEQSPCRDGVHAKSRNSLLRHENIETFDYINDAAGTPANPFRIPLNIPRKTQTRREVVGALPERIDTTA